jgi:hypothetical protein
MGPAHTGVNMMQPEKMARRSRRRGATSKLMTIAAITSLAAGGLAFAPARAADANKSIEEIRDAIQAANLLDGSGCFEALSPFLADKVQTAHEPAFPSDGLVEGAQLAKMFPLEHSLMNAAIENRRQDVTFTIKGHDIVMQGILTGRMRVSGALLVQPVNTAYTVENGRIVRIWNDASSPQSKEGYRLLGETFKQPALSPLFDAMRATRLPK